MPCHPDQGKWSYIDKNADGGKGLKIVRVCESLLNKYYSRGWNNQTLSIPTRAYEDCGAWSDPDPELKINDAATGSYEIDTAEPTLVYPHGAFKNAEEFYDGFDQAEIPFMKGFEI